MKIESSSKNDEILLFAQEQLDYYINKIQKKTNSSGNVIKNELTELNIKIQEIPKEIPKKARLQYEKYVQCSSTDAYGIIWAKPLLYLFGKSSRAILYSVYDILQQLGIYWPFPGSKTEYIPNEIKLDSLKSFKFEIPLFKMRGLIISGGLKHLNALIDYAAKKRINYLVLEDFRYYYRIEPNTSKRGIELNILSSDTLSNLCSSQKTEFEKDEKKLISHIHQIPISTKYLFNHNITDYPKRCSCKIDKDYSRSELLLKRLNIFANIPQIKSYQRLILHAEMGTFDCPKRIKPHPKISVEISPKHRCFSHSIEDPFCEYNKKIVKKEIDFYCKQFQKENIIISEFWLDSKYFNQNSFQFYKKSLKSSIGRIPIIPKIIKRDLLMYHQLGIENILVYTRGINLDFSDEYISPMLSICPNLLWDPQLNIQDLLKKFCLSFFGNENVQLFYDENESLDPKDLSWNRLINYLDLNKQRIELLNRYISSNRDSVYLPRIERYIKELKSRNTWVFKYPQMKMKGFISNILFKIRK